MLVFECGCTNDSFTKDFIFGITAADLGIMDDRWEGGGGKIDGGAEKPSAATT